MKKINRREFLNLGAITLSCSTLSKFLQCVEVSDTESIIGPYLQNVTENQATVCWLDFGDNDLDFAGKTKKTLEEKTIGGSGYVINQVRLEELEAGKTYGYSVNDRKRLFKTKSSEKEPFSFLVYGDSHMTTFFICEEHKKIIKQMEKNDFSFIIHTGDLVHGGNNFYFWEKFLKSIEPVSGRAPYYPVLGNHEENSKNYFKLFALPENERYYSFIWGGCRFIFLDSTKLLEHSKLSQLDYLSNEMKEDKMNIIVSHHPIYGAKKEGKELKEILGDRLDKADIVLSGHRHSYQRYFVNKTTYIVSGGGGAPLGDIEDAETLKFSAKQTSFY